MSSGMRSKRTDAYVFDIFYTSARCDYAFLAVKKTYRYKTENSNKSPTRSHTTMGRVIVSAFQIIPMTPRILKMSSITT